MSSGLEVSCCVDWSVMFCWQGEGGSHKDDSDNDQNDDKENTDDNDNKKDGNEPDSAALLAKAARP